LCLWYSSDGNGNIISLNRFVGDDSGGAFALAGGASVGADIGGTPEELSAGINVGLQFEQQSSYYGWELLRLWKEP
jgi:hypothetical protein